MTNYLSAKRIALFAMFVALNTLANIYEVYISPSERLSLVMTVVSVSGFMLGMAGGFLTGFLGDALGFLIKPSGGAYTPFIGLAIGFAGFLPAFLVFLYRIITRKKLNLISTAIIMAISSVLCFFIVTCGINTFVIWKLYISGRKTFKAYFIARISTQFPVSLVNGILSCVLCCFIVKIPYFKQFFYVYNTENDVEEQIEKADDEYGNY